MIRRHWGAAIALMFCAALTIAGVVLVGSPDPVSVWEYFNRHAPSVADAHAVLAFMYWVPLAAVGYASLVVMWRQRHSRRVIGRRAVRVGAVMCIGFGLLLAGLIRHAQPPYMLCCGSAAQLREAVELAGR